MREYSFEKIVQNPAVFADNRLPAGVRNQLKAMGIEVETVAV